MALGVGERAPDFLRVDQDGEAVQLSSLQGRPVVLYFYPRDETPGCTVEACAFRDSYEAFVGEGATVIGVSADNLESHQAFANRHRLPFHLLSDETGELRRLYQVRRSMGLFAGRETFVIDREGVIRHTFRSQLFLKKHVDEALAALRSLP